MTYTLFECLKEKVTEILTEQTTEAIVARVEKVAIVPDPDEVDFIIITSYQANIQ